MNFSPSVCTVMYAVVCLRSTNSCSPSSYVLASWWMRTKLTWWERGVCSLLMTICFFFQTSLRTYTNKEVEVIHVHESPLSVCVRRSGVTSYLEECPSISWPTQQWAGYRSEPGKTFWALVLCPTSETWQRASLNICRVSREFLTAISLTGTHL